ncbi:MAG: hypothetical protein QOJ90_2971 [Actinomycetota bacterium]|jgi:uncharacterized cupredoxin-like copper-binding protein|nr:hypothetical protein [Actinomycetota bacterium]MDQ1643620.1 hypothetical protein [Actinomycetota bacterium]
MGFGRHAARRSALRQLLVVAAITLLAGCGGSSGNSTSSVGSYGKGPSKSATASAAVGTQVMVEESDFALKLSPTPAKAGTYTFVAKNVGQVIHALEIEGQGAKKETTTISAGQSASLTITLKKGTYELYCPVDRHRDKGMKVTITVS